MGLLKSLSSLGALSVKEQLMYQNIIFDLYGTLLEIKTEEESPEFWTFVARFFSYNGAVYEPSSLKSRYEELVQQALAEKRALTPHPDIQILHVFKRLYEEKGIIPGDAVLVQTARVFRNLSTRMIRLFDGVKETLQALKERGIRIFLLSNGQREFTLPELTAFGIVHYFDRICSSSDLGICKPDPRFFEHLMALEGLNAQNTLMVGNDHTSDIAGAHHLGMDALYIHTSNSQPIDPSEVQCRFKIPDGNFINLKKLLLSLS